MCRYDAWPMRLHGAWPVCLHGTYLDVKRDVAARPECLGHTPERIKVRLVLVFEQSSREDQHTPGGWGGRSGRRRGVAHRDVAHRPARGEEYRMGSHGGERRGARTTRRSRTREAHPRNTARRRRVSATGTVLAMAAARSSFTPRTTASMSRSVASGSGRGGKAAPSSAQARNCGTGSTCGLESAHQASSRSSMMIMRARRAWAVGSSPRSRCMSDFSNACSSPSRRQRMSPSMALSGSMRWSTWCQDGTLGVPGSGARRGARSGNARHAMDELNGPPSSPVQFSRRHSRGRVRRARRVGVVVLS